MQEKENLVNADAESDPDLEAPLITVGTSWADTDSDSELTVIADKSIGEVDGDSDGVRVVSNIAAEVNANPGAPGTQVTLAECVAIGLLLRKSTIVETPAIPAALAVVTTSSNVNRGSRLESEKPEQGSLVGSSAFKGVAIDHVTEVPPIFLAYKRVSNEGQQISLVQVASTILRVMKDEMVLDAVQLMKAGWYIYMCTLKDRAALVANGVTIAGRYIQLQSEVRPEKQRSVRITLKDLPLHSVSNEDVLEAIRDICHVTSLVKYANVWYDGKLTNIRNGNRFVYVLVSDIWSIPDTLLIRDHSLRIFKPAALSSCKQC